MGKNRDQLNIIVAILQTSTSGANKTRIMFGANLSFKLLEKYLEVVVSAGFVQIDGSVYILTDAGRDFLRAYGDFRERYVKVQKLNDAFSSEYEKTVHFFEK